MECIAGGVHLIVYTSNLVIHKVLAEFAGSP